MEGENLQELVKKPLGIIREQEARIAGLEAQIVGLKTTIARLQKDSRNSSKPPSSDIVKAKPEAQKNNHDKPLKIGGQKGRRNMNASPSLRTRLTSSLR
jgi:hypothetical protein